MLKLSLLIPCSESHQRLVLLFTSCIYVNDILVIWPDKGETKHFILIFQEGRSTDHHLTSFFSVYCRSISKTCQRQGNLSVIFLIHAVKQWDFFKLQYVAAQTNCWPTQLNGPHLQLRHYLTSLGNCTDDMLLGQYNGLWYFGYSHGKTIFLRLFFLSSFRKKTLKLVSFLIFH